MKYRILIVEDDRDLARCMQQALEAWDYEAEPVQDFHHVQEEFERGPFHLILMDVTLPFLSGFEWTRRIRKVSQVPILFVSSAQEHMNLVMAVSMGADDYLTKPFETDVLAAKIQALLRRTYDFQSPRQVLEIRGIRFEPADCSVTCQDQRLELSRNEAKILRLLMEKQNQIVSREALMEALWKTDCFIDENTLSVNINRLRRKLESIGIRDLIQTRKGLGYLIR